MAALLGKFAGITQLLGAFAAEMLLIGLAVDIAAPVGAFPRGVTVIIKSVEEETVLEAVESAVTEAVQKSDAGIVETKVVKVRALDITFYNKTITHSCSL